MERHNPAGDGAEYNENDVALLKVEPGNSADRPRPSLDVIFIHGLGGHHVKTWRASDHDMTWPQRVANAHPDVQVWSLAYPARAGNLLDFGNVAQPDTAGLAVLAMDRMQNERIGDRPCILVCHSLGGLIAKRILCEAWRGGNEAPLRLPIENIRAVMFCGTPHRGSGIASVLKGVEWVKEKAPRAVLSYLGFDYAKCVAWLTRRVANTTDLIEELVRNNVELQHLNEEFVRYFQCHGPQGFMVKVYAETEPLMGVMIVPSESADPNLSIGPRGRVIPVPLQGKSHSTIVKPTSSEDPIVRGLDYLVSRVRDTSPDFGLQDGIRRKVARMLHAELVKHKELIELDVFRAIADGIVETKAAAFHLARRLASAQGEEAIDHLASLTAGFEQIPRGHPDASRTHDALLRVGCTLLLVCVDAGEIRASDPEQVLDVEVPRIEDDDQLDIMIEVLHASLRDWPVRLKLMPNDHSRLRPSSRILRPAGHAPRSWRDEDHLRHLVERILAANTLLDPGGIDDVPWPGEEDIDAGTIDENRLHRARGTLTVLLRRKVGLILHAMEEGSPYAGKEMRERLDRAFGHLVAVVLPAPNPIPAPESLHTLSYLQGVAQQFLLVAEKTRP
jgi:hypothetical protein